MSKASAEATAALALATTRADVALELHGAGQVGGALLRRLPPEVAVRAIHRSRGAQRFTVDAPRTIAVDATPPRLSGPEAEAWVAFLERTLRSGTPVATANKTPLALAWSRLDAAARAGGVTLAATATVGGGTPLLPALRALNGARPVAAIAATLSGTLGVVVPRVHAGSSLAEAVAEAQRLGFCEPDPTLDLDGTDAWVKACILHNALWRQQRPLGLDDRPAPLRLSEADIRALREPAVVARIAPGRITLGLAEWPAAEAGPGIQARATTAAGTITLSGAGAGPEATAAALLSDVLEVAAGRLPPGIH